MKLQIRKRKLKIEERIKHNISLGTGEKYMAYIRKSLHGE